MIGQFSRPYFTVQPTKIESCLFPACPINLGDITDLVNILLASFSRSMLSVTDPRFFPLIYSPHTLCLGHKSTGKNSVRNLQYGPRTRLVRGMYICGLNSYWGLH